jgi:hypothetical protein
MGGAGRRRSWAAVGVVVVTLILTGVLFLSAALLSAPASFCESCGPGWGVAVLALIPAAVCLVGGLVQAWWTGSGLHGTWLGASFRHSGASRRVVEVGHTWHISEPGVSLMDSPSGIGVVARLAPGTQVVEVERRGRYIKVAAPDGCTGWVDGRAVF